MPLATKIVQIAQADVPNKNGHVYPAEGLQKAIDAVPRPIYGTVGMPEEDPSTINLDQVAFEISDLQLMEDGRLMGKVTILDTPMGQMLFELEKASLVDYRSCGYGDVREEGDHKVIENFRLISINAVFDGA